MLVTVEDENDNAPVFLSKSSVTVLEDEPVGYRLLQVGAADPDEGRNGDVTYSLLSVSNNAFNPDDYYDASYFNLDQTTGKLSRRFSI